MGELIVFGLFFALFAWLIASSIRSGKKNGGKAPTEEEQAWIDHKHRKKRIDEMMAKNLMDRRL